MKMIYRESPDLAYFNPKGFEYFSKGEVDETEEEGLETHDIGGLRTEHHSLAVRCAVVCIFIVCVCVCCV